MHDHEKMSYVHYLAPRAISAMPSLLEQIQRDAVDPKISATVLLRRVKLAAAKLGLGSVEAWVELELNGYAGYEGDRPAYRMVRGIPKYYSHVLGIWRPLAGYVDGLSERSSTQAIPVLEALLAKGETGGSLMMAFPDSVAKKLDEHNDADCGAYALFVDKSQIVKTLEAVRDLALDWALKLETSGVRGHSDFTFTTEEREMARKAASSINIGTVQNFTGNLGFGNASGSITSSAFDVKAVRSLLGELRKHQAQLIEAIGDESAQKNLDALEAELMKNAPSETKVNGILSDVRNSLSGAAGNLFASGAISLISRILGV